MARSSIEDPSFRKIDLTIAQVLSQPRCDIPYKCGLIEVTKDGLTFQEQTLVLRFTNLYCFETDSKEKYPWLSANIKKFSWHQGEGCNFSLKCETCEVWFKAKSSSDLHDWRVRWHSLKTLDYQFVTVEGCSTLLNNLHNMVDLLQMAKLFKVDLFGVHGEYLRDMYNKDFFHKCQMQKKIQAD